MLTKEKVESVKKQLRSGVPEGEIKKELRKQGHTEQEISIIFKPSQINPLYYLSSALLLFAFGVYQSALHHHGLIFFILSLMAFIIYFVENRKRKN